MADDWDLHAVVRGCSAFSSSATTTATVFSSNVSSHTSPVFTFEPRSNTVVFGETRDLYTPFTKESNASSFSCLNYPEEPRQRQNQKRPLSLSASSSSVTSKPTGASNTSRSKRRFDLCLFSPVQQSSNLLSNQTKKVSCVFVAERYSIRKCAM